MLNPEPHSINHCSTSDVSIASPHKPNSTKTDVTFLEKSHKGGKTSATKGGEGGNNSIELQMKRLMLGEL